MFSKPLHPETMPKETRSVKFCLERNKVVKTYPAKYVRQVEQVYPRDQEEQVYDRRTEDTKKQYKLNKMKIMLEIQKTNFTTWFNIHDKETVKYLKNAQIRKDILSSKTIMSLWVPEKNTPSYNETLTEPISSDEDSSDEEDDEGVKWYDLSTV
tara:strand:+ start:148 stop:609 length:462 start_codon:yes stop_codon:yes gene_type:complete